MSTVKPVAPVIDNIDNVPRTRRTLYGVVTLVAWVAYAFLWLPLITLVAWWLGVRTTYLQLYVEQTQFDPTLVVTLPLLALICATLLIGWAEWNRWRFGDRDRRASQQDVRPPEVAATLEADAHLGRQLMGAKRAVLDMDAEGRPLGVQVHEALVEA